MSVYLLEATHAVSVVSMMDDETFTDINGKAISLDCQRHSSFCREFTVSSSKMSVGKVAVYTCCVWLVAYAVFFVTEVRPLDMMSNRLQMLCSESITL